MAEAYLTKFLRPEVGGDLHGSLLSIGLRYLGVRISEHVLLKPPGHHLLTEGNLLGAELDHATDVAAKDWVHAGSMFTSSATSD